MYCTALYRPVLYWLHVVGVIEGGGCIFYTVLCCTALYWPQVVEVIDDGSGRIKIGCSIKLADQTSGDDLDPAGTK